MMTLARAAAAQTARALSTVMELSAAWMPLLLRA
jgi:hypothetical protein